MFHKNQKPHIHMYKHTSLFHVTGAVFIKTRRDFEVRSSMVLTALRVETGHVLRDFFSSKIIHIKRKEPTFH